MLEVTKEVLEEELTASKEYEPSQNYNNEYQNQKTEIENAFSSYNNEKTISPNFKVEQNK